jgi:coenzyme Q-binding protein COQ10
VRISKRVRHRWEDLFALVLDLESYPEFLPHCRAVRVLSRKMEGDPVIVSRMTVGLSALEVSYANRTRADRAARTVSVEAIDGPLEHLWVAWQFDPDGDATVINFSVDFAFSNPILSTLASHVFESMFVEIVDAFERRAESLFRR